MASFSRYHLLCYTNTQFQIALYVLLVLDIFWEVLCTSVVVVHIYSLSILEQDDRGLGPSQQFSWIEIQF